jgi:hypothetical protein
MAKHTNLTSLFTAIADAIRAKKGTTGTIVADNFPEEIASIQSGGFTIETGIISGSNVGSTTLTVPIISGKKDKIAYVFLQAIDSDTGTITSYDDHWFVASLAYDFTTDNASGGLVRLSQSSLLVSGGSSEKPTMTLYADRVVFDISTVRRFLSTRYAYYAIYNN